MLQSKQPDIFAQLLLPEHSTKAASQSHKTSRLKNTRATSHAEAHRCKTRLLDDIHRASVATNPLLLAVSGGVGTKWPHNFQGRTQN